MDRIKDKAIKVEALAREAFDAVHNDDLRLEIQQIAEMMHTVAFNGARSHEVALIADSFDICTEGLMHRVKDRQAKKMILDELAELAALIN